MDRNTINRDGFGNVRGSLSARRAWIEIEITNARIVKGAVALRKESVDRNVGSATCSAFHNVALRKESVDRNYNSDAWRSCRDRSLSARRAWIEIACNGHRASSDRVALRKESVDRNVPSVTNF